MLIIADDLCLEAMAKAMISDGKAIQCPLKKLELSKNEITCKGITALLRTLQRGPVSAPDLVYLSLNENKVGPQGADLLARLLAGSKTLLHLHLRDNLVYFLHLFSLVTEIVFPDLGS